VIVIRAGLPVPQNVANVSAWDDALSLPAGKNSNTTDVSPWYGVYEDESRHTLRLERLPMIHEALNNLSKIV
jgi:hypothetical protein